MGSWLTPPGDHSGTQAPLILCPLLHSAPIQHLVFKDITLVCSKPAEGRASGGHIWESCTCLEVMLALHWPELSHDHRNTVYLCAQEEQ